MASPPRQICRLWYLCALLYLYPYIASGWENDLSERVVKLPLDSDSFVYQGRKWRIIVDKCRPPGCNDTGHDGVQNSYAQDYIGNLALSMLLLEKKDGDSLIKRSGEGDEAGGGGPEGEGCEGSQRGPLSGSNGQAGQADPPADVQSEPTPEPTPKQTSISMEDFSREYRGKIQKLNKPPPYQQKHAWSKLATDPKMFIVEWISYRRSDENNYAYYEAVEGARMAQPKPFLFLRQMSALSKSRPKLEIAPGDDETSDDDERASNYETASDSETASNYETASETFSDDENPLSKDIRQGTFQSYLTIHVHYLVSPALLYSLAKIGSLTKFDRQKTKAEQEKIMQEYVNVNWPKFEKGKRFEKLQALVNHGGRNGYEGDPKLAVLRDELILAGTMLWIEADDQDQTNPFNSVVPPTCWPKTIWSKELVRRFDWNKMTLSQAYMLSKLMYQEQDPFLAILGELRQELNPKALHGPDDEMTDKLYEMIYLMRDGYDIASKALIEAIGASRGASEGAPESTNMEQSFKKKVEPGLEYEFPNEPHLGVRYPPSESVFDHFKQDWPPIPGVERWVESSRRADARRDAKQRRRREGF